MQGQTRGGGGANGAPGRPQPRYGIVSQPSTLQSRVPTYALVQAYRRGNQAALDALMLRYHQFVRLKASSYFLAGGDAEDLIQEGMVGLYKAVRDYRDDRLASFRSFAELCITRQIITAIKTATRQKHVPLNGYLSFSQSPSDSSDDGDCSLADVLPGPSAHDPVNQVISSEEVESLTGCLTRLLSDLEGTRAAPLPAGL